jgi:Fic family protein
MNYAIGELKNLPLSNRLIRSTHKVLLSSVRGKDRAPGEFRISQNWIGGASLRDTTFIPPVHTELPELLSDLELFLNNSEIKIPHLIRIAIAHYQFETIHPFLDGNGRIGRLLISLYLVSNGILEKPLLYLSDFFERNKSLYYDNLTNVRHKNDLVQWIKFFLVGVLETADKSSITLRNILELKSDLEKNKIMKMGKRATKGSVLLQYLFSRPVVNGKLLGSILQLSPKATNLLIQEFLEANILVETTGNSRNKSYIFEKYLMMF